MKTKQTSLSAHSARRSFLTRFPTAANWQSACISVSMRHLSLRNHSQVEAPARWPLLGLLAVALAFPGCAGGGASSGTPPPPPPTVTVSVTPPTGNVLLGKTLQLSVAVTGTENTTVVWSVNGVPGGNSSLGTVAPSGLYTAPADLPSPASVQVAAISTASQSASASAQVTIISDVSVGVSSPAASVELGAKQNFSATITSAGQPDSTIRWILSGAACPSGCGSVDTSGNYTSFAIPALAHIHRIRLRRRRPQLPLLRPARHGLHARRPGLHSRGHGRPHRRTARLQRRLHPARANPRCRRLL